MQERVAVVCVACNKICFLNRPSTAKVIGATVLLGPLGFFGQSLNMWHQCPGCGKKYGDLKKAARRGEIVFRRHTPDIPAYDPNEKLEKAE